jgi:hypothetical protein
MTRSSSRYTGSFGGDDGTLVELWQRERRLQSMVEVTEHWFELWLTEVAGIEPAVRRLVLAA